MVTRLLLLTVLLGLAATAPAQTIVEREWAVTEGETIIVDEGRAQDDAPASETTPSPPVDIWDRIRRGYALPPLRGPRVEQALRQYLRDPEYVNRVTQRAGKYLYHIVEEVERRGLPAELALLPFVESAFQPEALSRAKASGLWQFVPSTGRIYDLRQDLWRDERRDVMESTRAALDYLTRLYQTFGDWQLALAAYNWGEGSVSRAIRRAASRRQPTDYEHLRMPRETAWYVPRLMAVSKLVAEPERYGVTLPEIENEPYFVRLTKGRDIDVATAARLAGMDPDEFRELNPGFNLPVIVASHRSSFLLPADRVSAFIDNLADWLDSGQPLSNWRLYRTLEGDTPESIAAQAGMTVDELRQVNHIPPKGRILPGSTLLVHSQGVTAPEIASEELNARLRLAPPPTRRIVYRVRRGDTIYDISRRYGVSQSALRRDNRLTSSQLKIGQRLIIVKPAPRDRAGQAVSLSSGQTTYQVRRGDTLWSIAQRFNTTVARLQRDNQLRGTRLTIGDTLVIRR